MGFRVCFVAGTPIVGPHGSKPIEAFKDYETHGDGCDTLVSRDEFNDDGVLTVRRVLRRFERVGPVLDLTVGGRGIGTTHEHPFFARGKGWTKAHELRVGDEVRLMGPGWATVEAVSDTGRLATVYNLEIEDDHTYFVGCDEWGFSVWAHNEGCDEFLDNMVRKKHLTVAQADDFRHDPGFRSLFEFVDNPTEIIQKWIARRANASEIYGIPLDSKSFGKWFDQLPTRELDALYDIPDAKELIKDLLRHGGGDHEWLQVSQANLFKRWGVTHADITTITTPTTKTWFIDPADVTKQLHAHTNTSVSSLAHKEMAELARQSSSFAEYAEKLRAWAPTRLPNGVADLPPQLR